MPQTSAGLLVYRRREAGVEFLLVHPGGPFWRTRDHGAWTVPKGVIEPGEDPKVAARREFVEETGLAPPLALAELEPCRQAGGKLARCWMGEADLDLTGFASNTFALEWPRKSGRFTTYPEADQAAYFPPAEAFARILASQQPLLRDAMSRLGLEPTGP